MAASGFAYPDAQIDPKDKNFNWQLQYCKAAWADASNYMPSAILFNRSSNRFWEIKQYTMGKQSISKYKKVQPGDEPIDNTELNNDSTVVPILPKFRNIALSKIRQKGYNIQCKAVDPLARSEEDQYFNQMKVKIMMRQMAEQQGSELAQSPMLRPNQGEPEDEEALQMQMEWGYKHVMALNAEEGIQLTFGQNGFEHKRGELDENLYDFGIGGWKIYLDEKGMPKFRAVCGETLITSYCQKADFSDAVHIGEIIQVSVNDLVPFFDKGQIEQICKNVAGKFSNPSSFDTRQNRWWDKFNVMVLDLQFFSWNTKVYKSEIDNRGNERFFQTDYKNIQFASSQPTTSVNDFQDYGLVKNEMHGGSAYPQYISSCEKVVYKAKWLIGTDLMYDYGLKENQTSDLTSWWDKKLDYIIGAWSFYKMMFTGVTEWLIPIADAYQLTWRKLQNLKNKLIPYLIEIDLTALEKISLGKGNDSMTPAQVIDFAFANHILVKRSNDAYRNNPNYKAMEIHATGQLQAFAQLYTDLDIIYNLMQRVSGLNELTDGSTPNAKTLVPVANAAMEATNNALYLISDCEKKLIQRLAEAVVEKIQLSIGMNNQVEGYAKALGSNTVKFFQINPNISLYQLGIFITDDMTVEEKQMMMQEINLKDSQGLLTPADKFMVMDFNNIKKSMMYLNYIVNKRTNEQHQRQMELVQQQGQQNQQSLMMAEQAKQQTIMLQGRIDIEKIMTEKKWDFEIEQMKKMGDFAEGRQQGHAKVIASQIQGEAKVMAQHIAAEASKEKGSNAKSS